VILPVAPEIMRNLEHQVDLVLAEMCTRAAASGVDADYQTAIGATHTEICAAAERLDVDLIVIGTHGRGGLGHTLLGSVAEKILRKAPCPVLTVRPHMQTTFAHP